MSETPALPPPPSAEEVLAWLASDLPACKQQAYAALVHPQFQVPPLADELHRLAHEGNTQARHIAAVAMGKDAAFAEPLAKMLGTEEHPIVRTAAAHALFRISRCPDEALTGLAAMLISAQESERKIAEATLNYGSTNRLSCIARTIGNAPDERLNIEALSAFASAAQINPDSRNAALQWLSQLATRTMSSTLRVALCTAYARLTEGSSGVAELWTIVESNASFAERQEAMLALGKLGEIAESCRNSAIRLLLSEQDEACVTALCRLIVELKTPPETLPVEDLLRVITYAQSAELITSACMMLSLGGRSFGRYAEIVANRHSQSAEPIRTPLARCHEIISGYPITTQKT